MASEPLTHTTPRHNRARARARQPFEAEVMPNPNHRRPRPNGREDGDDRRLQPVGMNDIWTVECEGADGVARKKREASGQSQRWG